LRKKWKVWLVALAFIVFIPWGDGEASPVS